jgi:hypothetical protein
MPLFSVTPVCGAAILLNKELLLAGQLRFYGLFALLLLVPVGLVLPRYAAGLAYFGGDMTPPLFRFSLAETDRLAATVAPTVAVIDVGVAPQFNFFWMSNLGGVEFPSKSLKRRGAPS